MPTRIQRLTALTLGSPLPRGCLPTRLSLPARHPRGMPHFPIHLPVLSPPPAPCPLPPSYLAHRPFPPSECARVNFDVGGGKDRASTKLSGKRKNRGAPLHPNTLLARVEGKGGER